MRFPGVEVEHEIAHEGEVDAGAAAGEFGGEAAAEGDGWVVVRISGLLGAGGAVVGGGFDAEEVVVDFHAEEEHVAHLPGNGAVDGRSDEDQRGSVEPVAVPGQVPHFAVAVSVWVEVEGGGEVDVGVAGRVFRSVVVDGDGCVR